MVLIKDAYNPSGRLVPYRTQENLVGKCKTRKMTAAERKKYGEPVFVDKEEPQEEKPAQQRKRKQSKDRSLPKDYEFGAKLRAERKRLGMGSPTFSKMIGIPKSTLESVESAKFGVRYSTKLKICKALGWDIECFEAKEGETDA